MKEKNVIRLQVCWRAKNFQVCMFVVKGQKDNKFASLFRVCTSFINFNYGPQAEHDRV